MSSTHTHEPANPQSAVSPPSLRQTISKMRHSDTIEPFLVARPATPVREFSCSVDYCCSDPKNRPKLVHIPCLGRNHYL